MGSGWGVGTRPPQSTHLRDKKEKKGLRGRYPASKSRFLTNKEKGHKYISRYVETYRGLTIRRQSSVPTTPDPDHTRLARKGYAWGKWGKGRIARKG